MPKSPHRTSAIRSNALNELRRRHQDEFDEILNGLLEVAGIETAGQTRDANEQRIIDYIQNYPSKFGPSFGVLKVIFNWPDRTLRNYLWRLRDEGVLLCPGQGRKDLGYRLVAQPAQKASK